MEYNEHANTGTDVSMSNSGNFEDYEFVPAVIEVNKDPLHFGRIKVSAPGVFNANNTNPELLPWCYPWFMCGNANYSQMERGAKVWLIKNKKRQDENWYMPMYELHAAAQKFVTENRKNHPEIFSYRITGAGENYMVYDSQASYKMVCGKSSVNVSGGGINMSSDSGQINISNDGKVSIGPKDSGVSEPVPLGKTVVCKLNEMLSILINAMNEMEQSVPEFSPAVASGVIAQLNELNNSTPEILTENICITESHYEAAVNGAYKRAADALDAVDVPNSSTEYAKQQQQTADDVEQMVQEGQ